MRNTLIPHNRPCLDSRDLREVQKPLKGRWIAHGLYNQKFEAALAAYLGRRYACAVSSGTAALHLALLALEIKRGDEVILPTYVCSALLNAVHYVGATPVLADADPANLGPSAEDVRRKITKKTRAVIVNHTFGFPASLLKIKSFGVPVIEDCAQALGSTAQGRKLGTFGDLVTCSFYATKVMTTGYGGMVLTDQPKYQSRIADLLHFDRRTDYKVRYNYGLSDILAAVGLSQFSKLGGFLRRRRKIAAQYLRVLEKTPFYFWKGSPGEQPNYYRFVIGCLKPYPRLVEEFRRQGIQVISPWAPYQMLHRYLGENPQNYPVAEAVSRAVVSLPIHPSLKDSEVRRISRAIENIGSLSLSRERRHFQSSHA